MRLYNLFQRKMAQRRLWTQFQDNALRYLRQQCQIQKWSQIALKMIQTFKITDRNQKQCRDRYTNSLNPNLNLSDWNEDDQLQLIECHKKYGNKWTIIAEKFKGRTDSFIKNHFYSRLRKCIRKLNRFIDEEFKKKYKKLNLNIIFKLTNLVQDKLTKITQEVREFYERLMYNLVDFSLKAQEGIRQYDANQIQTFILALTSLENLSGAIGANRKPKRGRGHKREERYLISTDGLCLILLQDQLILKKQTDFQLKPLTSINYDDDSQMASSQQLSQSSLPHQQTLHQKVTRFEETSEMEDKPNQLIFKGQFFKNKNIDLTTKVEIDQKISNKQTVEQNRELKCERENLQGEHEGSSYCDIMDYIMQNSFDCNDNMLSLSKQASFEFDNLF